MPPCSKHPDKDIEKALKAAEKAGWAVTSAGNHAKRIVREVKKCPSLAIEHRSLGVQSLSRASLYT